MSAHILLNVLNQFRKRDKMQGFVEHFIAFAQCVYKKFTNTCTRASILDSTYLISK